VVTVPSEKITLLEALSLAGDVTIFGKRNTVLVIRESEGQRVTKRLDLTSNEIFLSPYYYLKPNDIVYVEPNKARVASASRSFQVLPLIISAITASVIIFDRLLR
jgi:polysaccharide biosynthesis/export protein